MAALVGETKRLERAQKASSTSDEDFIGFAQGLRYSFNSYEIEIQEDWSGEGIMLLLILINGSLNMCL